MTDAQIVSLAVEILVDAEGRTPKGEKIYPFVNVQKVEELLTALRHQPKYCKLVKS